MVTPVSSTLIFRQMSLYSKLCSYAIDFFAEIVNLWLLLSLTIELDLLYSNP